MKMKEDVIRINKNTFIHTAHLDGFKSNVIAVFLLTDLNKDTVTKNALIPAVLRRGTEELKTMKEITTKMNDMYGSVFDASIDKLGDKQSIQLYLSMIDNNYALEGEDLLSEGLNFIYNVLYNPKLEDNVFDAEYVEQEKQTLRELIKGKINDKGQYANYRCLQEMLGDDPYALYKYGSEEDLDSITPENLYEQYKKLLETSEIHFYVYGNISVDQVKNFFEDKFEKEEVLPEKIERTKKAIIPFSEEKNIVEKMNVIQGKLVLGYDLDMPIGAETLYKVLVYNAILGSSATSKLFQNVREKASLAYTIRSIYIKQKGVFLISAGIETNKFDKALELTKKQVQDMKDGNFSDEDIKDAKIFLENLFLSCLDDQTTLIELNIGQFITGINDSIEEMVEKINNVSREDIIEVANKIKLKTTYYLKNL